MKPNAYRTLLIGLAAIALVLLFTLQSSAAKSRKTYRSHRTYQTHYKSSRSYKTSSARYKRTYRTRKTSSARRSRTYRSNRAASARYSRKYRVASRKGRYARPATPHYDKIKSLNLTLPPLPESTDMPPSEPVPASPDSTTLVEPKRDGIEVRSDNGVIGKLSRGVRVHVVAREGQEYRVKLPDGRVGSVPVGDVILKETRKPLPVSDNWSMKRNIVSTAYAYRGARYRRGGASAGGFDCSGFVKFLYARMGVKLPHSSRAQYACGRPVARADLAPGDIVCFKGTYRRGISHVGVYVGNNKFIHASTSRGGVRLDDLNAAYYRRRYAGARRID